MPGKVETLATGKSKNKQNSSGNGDPPKKRRGGGDDEPPMFNEEPAALHEVAQTRYLNYALSVITSRAIPDVRDGLKPVQRRILYTMWQQGVTGDAKHRKCAKIVGDVMGNYHPHGDASIYDALVRMAQSFNLRAPLVDGSGNFGSLDGDPAAAYRYTECRLATLADQILGEIDEDTVHFRPNYDGTKQEPVVLPSAIPNMLINGAAGIAVGMATNIPPHNPEEVVSASVRLLDALVEGRQLTSRELCRTIKGPDFPTGGHIVASAEELKQVYETGQGSIKVRGTWELAETGKTTKTLNITSIPYTVNKSVLVERIADVVVSRKMPMLLDVRDVSTDDVRIELELKKEADEHKVLAYLFKHTPLQTNFAVNLTCLVPTENPEVGRPERLDLQQILWHFLHFRLDVVTRRLTHELKALDKRIHILEGFEKIFDALDAILKIIRASDGKSDAAQKIMAKYQLDAEQTDAILELKLYRLARLEILVIQKELKDKRKRAKEIKELLQEEESKGRWALVRQELVAVTEKFGKNAKRRTLIESVSDEQEFTEEDLIVAEDNVVLLTADGWVKRQKGDQGPGLHAPARGRRGARLRRRLDPREPGVLLEFRHRLQLPHDRRPSHHRLRRANPEAVQAQGRRKDHRLLLARLARDRRHGGARRRQAAEDLRGRRHQRRLRLQHRHRAVPGTEHAHGPSLREGRRRRDGRRGLDRARQGSGDLRHARRPRPDLHGR